MVEIRSKKTNLYKEKKNIIMEYGKKKTEEKKSIIDFVGDYDKILSDIEARIASGSFTAYDRELYTKIKEKKLSLGL